MPGRLDGRRILVLRPVGQAHDLADALLAEGAEPVLAPAVAILEPNDFTLLDDALGRPHDWTVFTSVNGVAAVGRRPWAATFRGRLAAVGPATAEALEQLGLHVAFLPTAYTTAALARELPGPPGSVCLVRADIAGGDLEAILLQRGFSVERVNGYRTEPADPAPIRAALAAGVDAVALTSASIADAFVAALDGRTPGCPVFSIGPATTAAARRSGLTVAAEASPHTIPGLVQTIVANLGL